MQREIAGYVSITLWLLVAVIPSLGFRLSDRFYYHGEYEKARRLKNWLRWLHPLRDWPWQEALYRAHTLLHQDNYAAAITLLEAAQCQPPTPEQICILFYLRRDWRGLITWWQQIGNQLPLKQRSSLYRYYLLALGETGTVKALVEEFQQEYPRLEKLPSQLDYCYLYVFAFSGRVETVNKMMHAHILENINPDMRAVWSATAYLAAGQSEMAYALLRPLVRTAPNGIVRMAAEIRLQNPPPCAPALFTPAEKTLLMQIEQEWRRRNQLTSVWQ
ncbi:MAG: hypothetical protein R3C14_25175 [Caldilineaceae bacterium]